jgi:hypothetical protein
VGGLGGELRVGLRGAPQQLRAGEQVLVGPLLLVVGGVGDVALDDGAGGVAGLTAGGAGGGAVAGGVVLQRRDDQEFADPGRFGRRRPRCGDRRGLLVG